MKRADLKIVIVGRNGQAFGLRNGIDVQQLEAFFGGTL
jgi:hypothetical protein